MTGGIARVFKSSFRIGRQQACICAITSNIHSEVSDVVPKPQEQWRGAIGAQVQNRRAQPFKHRRRSTISQAPELVKSKKARAASGELRLYPVGIAPEMVSAVEWIARKSVREFHRFVTA